MEFYCSRTVFFSLFLLFFALFCSFYTFFYFYKMYFYFHLSKFRKKSTHPSLNIVAKFNFTRPSRSDFTPVEKRSGVLLLDHCVFFLYFSHFLHFFHFFALFIILFYNFTLYIICIHAHAGAPAHGNIK